jgi:MipA family protein
MPSLRSGLIALSVLAAGPALAADIPPRPAPQQYAIAPTPTHDIVLEIGAGAQVRPTYEGSKDFEVWPTGFFELHYLRIPGYGEVKKSRIEQGWSFGPSLRYTSKRKSADYSELNGLDDVGASYEAGARVAWGKSSVSIERQKSFGAYTS